MPSLPGDELGAPGFNSVSLPSYLNMLRNYIFGLYPDNAFLNYRLRQYMQVLHASFLAPYVYALDKRITYSLTATDFVSNTLFVPQVTPLNNSSGLVTVTGTPTPPDISGIMNHVYLMTLNPDNSITTVSQTLPLKTLTEQTQPATLPGSGYTISIFNGTINGTWLVEILNRPQYDLGAIIASINNASVLTQLFGAVPVPPYDTFANLWYDQNETPRKLAALLLAIIYRTEEVRSMI